MITPIETETALSFFLRMLLGHFVGDFVLQPYWLVMAKRQGWPGLIVHVGVVTFITALLAWGSLPFWWMWMVVLFIVHLFIDQFRTFVFTNNKNGRGLLLLLADQLAHMVSLLVIAGAAAGWSFNAAGYLFAPDAPNLYRLTAYLTGLAFLIGAVPVLEVEIFVAVWAVQGKETTKTVGITSEDRWLGSLERVFGVGLMLSGPFFWLAPLAFIPRLMVMIYRGQAKADLTAVITKVLTSFATTALVSLILHNIVPPNILW